MLSINFTLPMVVGYLRAIAKRDPERIGKSDTGSCVYATNEGGVLTPVCIVGQMFADLGLLRLLMNNPSDLIYSSANSQACGVSSSFWDTLAKYGITADDEAKAFAHSVQRKQDDSLTWSEAYNLAETEYRDEAQRVLDTRLTNLFF